jgi:hypothetical protein
MKIISILLGTVILSSCQNAPDNVKSYSENSIDSTLNTAQLDEMYNNKEQYITELKNMKFDNMTFNDNLTVDIPKQINEGEYICPTDFQNEYKKIFTYYDEDFSESNVQNNDSTYPTGPDYLNEEKNLSLSIGCTGYFTYSKNFDEDLYINQSEFVTTFTKSEAENCDDAYKLADSKEEIKVSDAIKTMQEFADDFTDMCDYPNKITLVRINLYQCDSGYFYKGDFTENVSGSNILEYYSAFGDTDENLINPAVCAYMCSAEINSFTTNSYFEEYSISGNIDSVIDLNAAAKYLNENLAGNMNLDVKRIELEYCMIKTDNIQQKNGDEETDTEKAPWATYCSYDLYKAQPCWVFYFDETENQELYAILNCDDLSITFVDNQKSY